MPRTVIVLLLSAFFFLTATSNAAAPGQDPTTSALGCSVKGGDVALEWNIAFLVAIKGWLIERDGQKLAVLDPDTQGYVDQGPPAGDHVYVLSAISADGQVGVMGRCSVSVPPTGLRCAVDGRKVRLEWGPIPIDIVIDKFAVYRDEALIATVPPSVLTYEDTLVELGEHIYRVDAVISNARSFVVGKCSVRVDCFGLNYKVDGDQVFLDWDYPLGSIFFFVVSRDGVEIAQTRESQYLDKVPGPGVYLYQVYTACLNCEAASVLVASCRIPVAGDGVPAPEELTCRVVDLPQPLIPCNPVTPDGCGPIDVTTGVALAWKDPVAYDKLVLVRNGIVIATLAGSETSFLDRVGGSGIFAYSLYGVVGDAKSAPAECKVEVGPGEPLPPQGLTCSLNDIGPLDPAVPGVVVRPDGTVDGAVAAVVLNWWNPIPYRGLVVVRDNTAIAKLPGDAMVYRDVSPPEGKHLYEVFGVLADGRETPHAFCEVFVGRPLPPVEDLVCGVEETAAANTVDLAWKDPIAYEGIIISRNGQVVKKLEGDATSFKDPNLAPGLYLYEVVGFTEGGRLMSPPAACRVEVGRPGGSLLYFSTSRLLAGGAVIAAPPVNEVTCLLRNTDEVQGWSFGVQSDPSLVLPAEHSLEGTDTAALRGGRGPAFLAVKLLREGVTMGAVISDEAPFETLPPARAHPLLVVTYKAGPEGVPGGVYPLRYSNGLGDPPVQVLVVVNGFESRPETLPGVVGLAGAAFRRADTNGDGKVDISDPTSILIWLFLAGSEPPCLEAADTNGSHDVNIADAVYLFSYLFGGGPAPPRPFPDCGEAPAPLGCKSSAGCP
jgi:hypothetical protein